VARRPRPLFWRMSAYMAKGFACLFEKGDNLTVERTRGYSALSIGSQSPFSTGYAEATCSNWIAFLPARLVAYIRRSAWRIAAVTVSGGMS
jgi:hypothetical protein